MKNFKKSILSLILMVAINVSFAQINNSLMLHTSSDVNQIPITANVILTVHMSIPTDTLYVTNYLNWSQHEGYFNNGSFVNLGEPGTGISHVYDYITNTFPAVIVNDTNLHTYVIIDMYQTEITFGVKGTTSIIDTTSNTTGIKNSDIIKSNIVVYPNPIKDNLTILFNASEHMQKVDILDMQGRLVLSNANEIGIGQNTLRLDVSTLNTGIYFVKINNHSYKFIKA